MANYLRLSLVEREEISRGLAEGVSLREIARRLGRSASTISREIGRNCDRWWLYRAAGAQQHAARRRARSRLRRLQSNLALRTWVFGHLRLCWSPQQIAARLKQTFPHDRTIRLAHKALYT